ncbi:hypothetical protein pb186bvf_018263 [Paramecium bursaria]
MDNQPLVNYTITPSFARVVKMQIWLSAFNILLNITSISILIAEDIKQSYPFSYIIYIGISLNIIESIIWQFRIRNLEFIIMKFARELGELKLSEDVVIVWHQLFYDQHFRIRNYKQFMKFVRLCLRCIYYINIRTFSIFFNILSLIVILSTISIMKFYTQIDKDRIFCLSEAYFCYAIQLIMLIIFGIHSLFRYILRRRFIKKYTTGLFEHPECPICLQFYNKGEEIRILRCHEVHHFHRHCLQKWQLIQQFCPICRREIAGSF